MGEWRIMERIKKNPNNNKAKSLKIGVAVLGAAVALSACTNPKVTTAQSRSNEIQPCSTDVANPNSSDGVKITHGYNKLVAQAKEEAKTIYLKTMANGGKIVFNNNTGTSVTATKSDLTINYDNAIANSLAGFSAHIDVSKGQPQLGLGALVCNSGAVIYQTMLGSSIAQTDNAVANFPN